MFTAEKKKRRKERLLQKQQQTEEDLICERKVKALEEKIAKTDICELFPEFRPNKVNYLYPTLTFFCQKKKNTHNCKSYYQRIKVAETFEL